jgi:arylsulfatase A-like enzyme
MHSLRLLTSLLATGFRGSLIAVGALSGGCGDAAPARQSAILITLDTTNAVALDCYGTDRGVTPNLARLAAESLLFEHARTVAPVTLPAHSSMMTGLYPIRHSVRDNGLRPLPDGADTVAEIARAAGYQTAAFVSAIVLSEPYGLGQGFDVYDSPEGDAKGVGAAILDRPGDETVRRAQAWLAARDRSRPFFLWVHLFDPHAPYEAAEKFLGQAEGRPYLAEVAAADHAVGNLLAGLRAENLLDETWVVVVGDHGEGLNKHAEETHSILVYDSTMHVPLLVREPSGLRAGERSTATVSVVDVYATLLQGLGLAGDDTVDGRDLLGEIRPTRGVYFESYVGFLNYGWSPLTGWADRDAKYIHGREPELFDTRSDPREERNIFEARQDAAKRYTESIARITQAPRLEPGEGLELSDTTLDKLRSLGYASAGDADLELPDPLEPSQLSSPRKRMGELKRTTDAILIGRDGDRADAIVRLRAIALENSRNVYALETLSGFLVEEGEFAESIALLERLLELGRDRSNTYDTLGHAYEQLGNLERARVHYRSALERKPGDPHQLRDMQRVGE